MSRIRKKGEGDKGSKCLVSRGGMRRKEEDGREGGQNMGRDRTGGGSCMEEK